VLETLQTSSFYDFRSALFGASGGDSYRFRAIEWALGFLEPNLFEYATERQATLHGGDERRFADDAMLKSLESYSKRYAASALPPDIQEKVLHLNADAQKNVAAHWERAKKSETLRSALFAWLQRTPFLGETGEDLSSDHYEYFKRKYMPEYVKAYVADVVRSVELKLGDEGSIDSARKDAEARAEWFMGDRGRAAIVFILQFAQQPLLAWPAMLLEAFIDLDEAFSNWRERHVQMVAHVLGGGRVSTMGSQSSGLPYLRPTTGKKAFPEIWDARSFFLSRNEAAAVYPTMAKGDPYFARQMRLLRLAFEDDEQRKEQQKEQQKKDE
jgi:tryptophan 2,3-dioxygenase